ncbi:hypothetical protein L226DRAFT_296106 [Lentinus tigrinus ALCF2SS1-7]|uniref:uncharacterized protein n=1 Tax=Lentinus tigrinus ALCF2SS1-7 TaxID=1328758 RepID=UPI001165EB51|nr:hypothetical protein L226DRAFT_296106 [Lentinus tigrinus ALCF2SS1-7]
MPSQILRGGTTSRSPNSSPRHSRPTTSRSPSLTAGSVAPTSTPSPKAGESPSSHSSSATRSSVPSPVSATRSRTSSRETEQALGSCRQCLQVDGFYTVAFDPVVVLYQCASNQ